MTDPESRRTYKVSFEMSASEKDAEWFGAPTTEWIEEMVAGPGSVWKLDQISVMEER